MKPERIAIVLLTIALIIIVKNCRDKTKRICQKEFRICYDRSDTPDDLQKCLDMFRACKESQ
jgi:hypothetical protein